MPRIEQMNESSPALTLSPAFFDNELLPRGFYPKPKEPVLPETAPPREGLRAALEEMILSASGWRKIFAPGGEEDSSALLSAEDRTVTAATGLILGEFLCPERASSGGSGASRPVLVLGTDTRPTGPALAEILIRVLSAFPLEVRYLGVSPTPEIIRCASAAGDAFLMISASHNPVGYNGFKMGLKNGVLPADQNAVLVSRFRSFFEDTEEAGFSARFSRLKKLSEESTPEKINALYNRAPDFKAEALRHYNDFLKKDILSGGAEASSPDFFPKFRRTARRKGIGLIAELNGSARSCSVDRDFWEEAGLKVRVVNGRPGAITHPIVPEGNSLDLCRFHLEKAHREDPGFLLGYVPDNDGDRGNIVCFDTTARAVRTLPAQTVFSLAVLGELAFQTSKTGSPGPRGVVVNGPTSLRIERIAEAYGAEVVRTEVGEAHVVSKADELRWEGRNIPLAGEGSNGGSILYPSCVRDPMGTLSSLLRLLCLPELFEEWCRLSGQKFSPDFTLGDILKSLPVFTTTGTAEERAVMQVRSDDPRKLREHYESLFAEAFRAQKSRFLKEGNFDSYEVLRMEKGTVYRGTDRGFDDSGGFKILFRNPEGRAEGFLWMRGSKTEPLFRVLADVAGDKPAFEQELLELHRSLIRKADQATLDD